jgi:hypothetical protein
MVCALLVNVEGADDMVFEPESYNDCISPTYQDNAHHVSAPIQGFWPQPKPVLGIPLSIIHLLLVPQHT